MGAGCTARPDLQLPKQGGIATATEMREL